MIDRHQNKPYVIIVGDLDTPDQIFLVVEKTIISEITNPSDICMDCCQLSLSLISVILMAALICIPFMKSVILGLSCIVPVSVTRFLASLQSHA